jgi:hypothetical protein
MDQISKIKKICKDLLDTSYGDQISITDLIVIPTFRYDEELENWTKDSFSVFLTLKDKNSDLFTEKNFDNFFESYLGLEFCVEFS